MGKIERKYMAHYLDTSFGGTASWYRIGEDLEEYNVELNPDTEQKKNILGQNTFTHNGWEVSGDSSPFYCREGDELFAKLQEFVDELPIGDAMKTQAVEVHLWETASQAGAYPAYKQDCYVIPQSYGGDTSGYQIPFNVYYVGEKVAGAFNPTTKAWTDSL